MSWLASVAHTADVIPVSICFIGLDKDVQVTKSKAVKINIEDSI